MVSRQADKLVSCAAALLALYAGAGAAAEVRGRVSIDYQGLFQRDGAVETLPVSVALLPGAGQGTRGRAPGHRTIEFVGNRMQPAFITVQKGSAVEFINRDDVYHELFSLSPGKPVNTRLGKAGDPGRDRTVLQLAHEGTIHFFCRIHNKSYARIDVVDTPYIQMVEADGSFEFTGLHPGPWRLRVAAPAAETEWVEVVAMTSPPPLQLTLMSHGGGSGRSAHEARDAVDRLYRPWERHGAGP